MGFFVGFLSGFTLTTSALYITIQVHRSTRLDQKAAIREQTETLEWLALSRGAYDRRLLPKDEAPVRREGRLEPGMKDQLKHRWNEEVKALTRKAYDMTWEDVRDLAGEGWRGVKRVIDKE
ncbi:MICOS complex subunit Mic12 family protein [Aspergillus stella-maris]|uniref:MICOS complex subunit Mic12 family protein n=1 Tax=Aspergillus stella-maris TaxID=1810926 RepID=UPI003CCD0FEA